MSAPSAPAGEIVILVHGFNNDQTDMVPLRDRLAGLGYTAVTVSLPLRFAPLEECVSIFADQVLPIANLPGRVGLLHLVGYSMGGLVIRSFLADNTVEGLGRCVLIATPNRGTRLVDLADRFAKPLIQVYRPLQSLRTGICDFPAPLNIPAPEIGVIAGTGGKNLLGWLLRGVNDGRVELESAFCSGMTDCITRPHGHKEIHHQPETAQLVHSFLHTGSFCPVKTGYRSDSVTTLAARGDQLSR
ncbi:MAG: hypothetical protein PHG75_01160 [Syntrophomonas sp.]|nr:hypothetical protein [Syntrophomonas sp.]